MINIIKSMNYQTRNDIFTVITYLIAVVVQFAAMFFAEGNEPLTYTGSDFVVYMGSMIPVVCLILAFLLTCRICGWDYADRTLNYEVLSGHTRFQIYMGRILTSILWCVMGFLVISFLPVLIFTCINGWGYTLSFSGAILRYGLMVLLLIRLVTGFAVLTFIVRNSYIAMVLGYVWTGVSAVVHFIMEEIATFNTAVFVGWMNMVQVFTFENSKNMYIDGKDVTVFDGTISGTFLLGTVGWSLLVILVLLPIGYRVFRKHDLR
ncbi:MAG: hypothetical protein ACI4GW_09505 [Lachnospiraceae bacterium]